MANNKTTVFEAEIESSVRRYAKYVLGIDSKKLTIVHNSTKFEEFWKEFWSSPEIVLLVGCEDSIEKEVKVGLLQNFKYFHDVFPEMCGFISSPFNPALLVGLQREGFKDIADSGSGLGLEKFYDKIKRTFPYLSENLVELFKEAWQYFGVSPKERARRTHETVNKEQKVGIGRLKTQVANLITGIIRFKLAKRESLKFLLIDNNPERAIEEIDERFKGLIKEGLNLTLEGQFKFFDDLVETYVYEGQELKYKEFLERMQEENPVIELPCRRILSGSDRTERIKLSKTEKVFDLILVDMYLDEDDVDGIVILHQLTETFPNIPVFVLSISDDFEVVRKAMEAGADYYVIKNQVLSVLYAYFLYLDNLGEIINYSNEKVYQNSLVGNIRYWKFKKNLLWFGDKCYHMIDHAFIHTVDNWNYMNKILVPILKNRGKEKYFGNENHLFYAFCMAVWLHDIGHKGSDVYGEPHLIRNNHGYISGELILRYPEVFRIKDCIVGKGKDYMDDYYKDVPLFSLAGSTEDKKKDYMPALELMYERNDKLTTTEMIALFCIYHKRNASLDSTELNKILEKRSFSKQDNDKFLSLAALFRFIDSIDIRSNRVGDASEKNLKETVISNDVFFLTKKKERLPNDDERKVMEEYVTYLELQPTHFDLHASIKDIKFEWRGNNKLAITLITGKEEKWLKEKKVREMDKKDQSLYERLIGKNCYVFKELEEVKRYLQGFFEEIDLTLMNQNNKIYATIKKVIK